MASQKIELIPVDALRPDPRNARLHSPEQTAQIAASIREFGFTAPILALADKTIVAGHGRLEGAKAAGLERVPVLTVGADWTDEQRRLYALADNKIAANATWDEELLRAELADLSSLDIGDLDLSLTGFSASEIEVALSGWTAGAESAQKHGEHTDPIPATIKIHVAQANEHEARNVIDRALVNAGIDAL